MNLSIVRSLYNMREEIMVKIIEYYSIFNSNFIENCSQLALQKMIIFIQDKQFQISQLENRMFNSYPMSFNEICKQINRKCENIILNLVPQKFPLVTQYLEKNVICNKSNDFTYIHKTQNRFFNQLLIQMRDNHNKNKLKTEKKYYDLDVDKDIQNFHTFIQNYFNLALNNLHTQLKLRKLFTKSLEKLHFNGDNTAETFQYKDNRMLIYNFQIFIDNQRKRNSNILQNIKINKYYHIKFIKKTQKQKNQDKKKYKPRINPLHSIFFQDTSPIVKSHVRHLTVDFKQRNIMNDLRQDQDIFVQKINTIKNQSVTFQKGQTKTQLWVKDLQKDLQKKTERYQKSVYEFHDREELMPISVVEMLTNQQTKQRLKKDPYQVYRSCDFLNQDTQNQNKNINIQTEEEFNDFQLYPQNTQQNFQSTFQQNAPQNFQNSLFNPCLKLSLSQKQITTNKITKLSSQNSIVPSSTSQYQLNQMPGKFRKVARIKTARIR